MDKAGALFVFIQDQFRRRIRSRRFLVWVVIMPLLLMGFLHVVLGQQDITARVIVVNQDGSGLSNATVGLLRSEGSIEVSQCPALQKGIDRINRGKADALVVIPEDFTEKWQNITGSGGEYESIQFDVYYASGGEEKEVIQMTLKGISSEINDWIQGDEQKPVEIDPHSLETRPWSYSDLLVPGGVVIVVLQIGVFSTSNNSSMLEEYRLKERFEMLPIPSILPTTGMIITDALFTSTAGVLALGAGLLFFDIGVTTFSLLGSVLLIILTSFIACFIGYNIGRVSSTQSSAQGLSSMFMFPLLFFSEAFLFHQYFPGYVKEVALMLPTGPMMVGLKKLLYFQPSTADLGGFLWGAVIWLGVVMVLTLLSEVLSSRKIFE